MKCFKGMLILLMLLNFSTIFADGEGGDSVQNMPTMPENPFGMGVQFGSMTINGVNYNSIRLQPKFDFGIIGFGLDLNLEFDSEWNIRETEWNSWQAILSKLLYFSFGRKRDFVFVKIGNIDDFTLGNGWIMNRYSNMLNFPAIKKLGLAFDMDFKYAGFESMVDNIFDWDLMGLRLYVKPLVDTKMPILENLEFGLTVAADLDPQNPVPDSNKPYDYTDAGNNSNVVVWGLDVTLPVINNDLIAMKAYLDFAAISGKGSGQVLGVIGSIIKFIPYKFELTLLQAGFIPNYFDNFYDSARAAKYASLDNYTNSYFGFAFQSGFSLFDGKLIWNFLVADPDLFSTLINPYLEMNLILDKSVLFNKFGAVFNWTRQNIVNFGDIFTYQSQDSILKLVLDYYVSENMAIGIEYKKSFQLDSTGAVQEFTSTSISTRLEF